MISMLTLTKLVCAIYLLSMQQATTRLTGQELLHRVAELGDRTKAEKARACGYVTTGTDGKARVSFTTFYEALAVASGVPLEERRERKRPTLSYQTKVLTTGALLIGPRYVEEMGLQPGDTVALKVEPGLIAGWAA